MGRPVYLRKNRGEQRVAADKVIKPVYQPNHVVPAFNVFLANYQLDYFLAGGRRTPSTM